MNEIQEGNNKWNPDADTPRTVKQIGYGPEHSGIVFYFFNTRNSSLDNYCSLLHKKVAGKFKNLVIDYEARQTKYGQKQKEGIKNWNAGR